jgi:hypothetical protein
MVAGLLTAVAAFLVMPALLPTAAHGEHDRTCHPNGGVPPPSGGSSYHWNVFPFSEDGDTIIDVAAKLNPAGKVFAASGTASIGDTVLAAVNRGTSATCADTNDSGVTGIVALAIALRDQQSNELVLATVVPDEEIERDGQYEATMTFDRNLGSFPVSLEFVREPLPRFKSRDPRAAPSNSEGVARFTIEIGGSQ